MALDVGDGPQSDAVDHRNQGPVQRARARLGDTGAIAGSRNRAWRAGRARDVFGQRPVHGHGYLDGSWQRGPCYRGAEALGVIKAQRRPADVGAQLRRLCCHAPACQGRGQRFGGAGQEPDGLGGNPVGIDLEFEPELVEEVIGGHVVRLVGLGAGDPAQFLAQSDGFGPEDFADVLAVGHIGLGEGRAVLVHQCHAREVGAQTTGVLRLGEFGRLVHGQAAMRRCGSA